MIPCSSINNIITNESVNWYKYNCTKQNCNESTTLGSETNTEPFKGSLLANLSQNTCNITISNVTKTESGSYNIRVDGFFNGGKVYMLSKLAAITVTGMKIYSISLNMFIVTYTNVTVTTIPMPMSYLSINDLCRQQSGTAAALIGVSNLTEPCITFSSLQFGIH